MSTSADHTGVSRRALREGRAPRRAPVLAAVAMLIVALAVLAGCGDDGTAATSSPAAPATARDALVAYLGMLERGQFGDLDRVATPRYVDTHSQSADTALAEVRLVDVALEPSEGGERTLARMTVYIDPGPGNGPWGDEAGERQLFAYLVQSDDGAWLIDDFGTGP